MPDSGQKLLHYTVTGKIGEGGMGEVFRARDETLDREVALKFLPETMVQHPESLARFEREAKLLASLSHPGVAVVHGLHEVDGRRFLAMELVPGEDLAHVLVRGRLPLAEVIDIACQIAEALTAAHDQGVVHRDLKPSNVMITPEHRAKVLDFGLAKSTSPETQITDLSNSPTMTTPATMAGVILGTAAYMSPEQARGRLVDRRSDLWSFGCVLYEMLAGKTAFEGDTVTDIIAAIIHKEPDWDALPADLPAGVRGVLERCLRKEPDLRLRDAGDAALMLREALVEDSPALAAPAATSRRRTFWAAAAIAFLAAVVGTFVTGRLAPGLLSGPESPGAAQSARFTIQPPAGATMASLRGHLSPDGSTYLWNGRHPDVPSTTWLRPLDSLESTPVPLDRPTFAMAWSPDGRHIALGSGGKLRKVPVEGGDPQPLCDMPEQRGVSWGKDYLAFAGASGPIYRVPVTGGDPEPVTTVNKSAGETAHRFPHFLPDGETFLYVALPGKRRLLTVYAGHVDGRDPVVVATALNAPVYADPGYLVFQRGRSIVAQAFDPENLTVSGEPVPIAAAGDLHQSVGLPVGSVSRNGHLSFMTPGDTNTRLSWIDGMTGEDLGDLDLEPGTYDFPAVSPDGRYVALIVEQSPEESDVWVLELERMLLTRFTHGPGPHADPVWSPDGKYIAYATNTDGPWNIYRKPFPGGGPAETLVEGPEAFKNPLDWSPDGKYLLYDRLGEGTEMDIWMVPADGSGEPRLFVGGATNQREGKFSPDGRWVAYMSRETGIPEVYVSSFPDATVKHRISVDGGDSPTWTLAGTGIHFGTRSGTIALVSFQADPEVRTGIPRELFELPQDALDGDLARDGRVLMLRSATQDQTTSATVLMNWMQGLD